MVNEKLNKISDTLVRIINRYVEAENKPRKYGTEDLLYPSEVHMVMFVGNNEGVGVSELAKIAGVTKGAVSQMLKKLEKRELIQKDEDRANSSRVKIKLTNKGRIVYYAHEMHHEDYDNKLGSFLHNLDDEKIEVIQKFLDHLDQAFKLS